jgi:GxxExxY protein
MDNELVYKEDSYKIIGCCMDVHNELGHGFSEIVYKDALQIVFQQDNVLFQREKEYDVYLRKILLPHKFYADFVVFDRIIMEIKCVTYLTEEHVAQTLNYLKVSGCKLGLLVNFARGNLEYKRLVY